jgi:23S rRNA (uridine2552-2'-O)-methyltransferase
MKAFKNKKLSLSSKAWLYRHHKDVFSKAAIQDGYRSRAAYKLIEIHERYHLFVPNTLVVDLGAAPGGWSQVVVGYDCVVVAIDILSMPPINKVHLLVGDFKDSATHDVLHKMMKGAKAQVVLSDMAPNSTGNSSLDHLRIMALAEDALFFACTHLAMGGGFLAKIRQGSEMEAFKKTAIEHFDKVHWVKPKASRQDSAEVYLLARGFNGNPPPQYPTDHES